ncbi:MAG TPA: hypothetical protein VGL19_20985, partial [Polyangiaceae bacterium]
MIGLRSLALSCATAALALLVGCSSSGAGGGAPRSSAAGGSGSGGTAGSAGGAGAGMTSSAGSAGNAGATASAGAGGAGGAPAGGSAGSSAGENSGGSAGNAGAAGGTTTAMWTMNGGRYVLTLGSTYLELDPMNGARMTALRVGGMAGGNLLADSTVTGQADNWGSTFWPSPQTWPWPPTDAGSINAINTLPYTVTSDATSLTLTSAVNASVPKLQVIKKFTPDLAKEAIVIDYTVINGGTAPVTTAPWEVTRVAPGGITFYPAQSPPYTQATPLLKTTVAAGVTWYQHDPTDGVLYKLFG